MSEKKLTYSPAVQHCISYNVLGIFLFLASGTCEAVRMEL